MASGEAMVQIVVKITEETRDELNELAPFVSEQTGGRENFSEATRLAIVRGIRVLKAERAKTQAGKRRSG